MITVTSRHSDRFGMRDVLEADLGSALTELHQTTDDHYLMCDIETFTSLFRIGHDATAIRILREEIQPQLIPSDPAWDVVALVLDDYDTSKPARHAKSNA